MNETSSNTTLPKPVKYGILSSLWFLRWQLAIKSEIFSNDILILLTSGSWVPSHPKRDMGWVQLFYKLLLPSCNSSYNKAGRESLFISWLGHKTLVRSTHVVGPLRFKFAWA